MFLAIVSIIVSVFYGAQQFISRNMWTISDQNLVHILSFLSVFVGLFQFVLQFFINSYPYFASLSRNSCIWKSSKLIIAIYVEISCRFLNVTSFFICSEGLFMSCAFDYLTQDWNHKSFVLYAFICNFCVPMLCVIYFYTQIVKAVVVHEANLRAQAKKMNVTSLRQGQVIYYSTWIWNTKLGVQTLLSGTEKWQRTKPFKLVLA